MRDCIEQMRLAFEGLRDGTAQNQPRRRLILKTGSVLHSLAGACGHYFGTKYYSTNPRHGAHFFFTLFDAETAQPLAMMEANRLGQIRTGAASGYATDLLADPAAETLGVIGSGFQARSQVEAIRAVRAIREVRVWSRNADRASAFAEEIGANHAPSAEAAVHGARIVVTATNSKDPVLDAAWIGPGTLVNAMGSNAANRRELPADLVSRAGTVVVDSLEQARIEAGDLILAGSWDAGNWDNVVELKDVRPGYDPDRVTVFKSIGLVVEDVAAAAVVYERARERKLGRELYS